MNHRKFFSLILGIILLTHLVISPVIAVTPRWMNTQRVIVELTYDAAIAKFEIKIIGMSGTTKIDNVDIKFYRISDNDEDLIAQWDDLSTLGTQFIFRNEVDGVQPGYTYRLAFTADVHRNGTVESLDTYDERTY